MSFKQEIAEFSKDVEHSLDKMVKDKIDTLVLRRSVVSGTLGTRVCEIRAKLEITKQ